MWFFVFFYKIECRLFRGRGVFVVGSEGVVGEGGGLVVWKLKELGEEVRYLSFVEVKGRFYCCYWVLLVSGGGEGSI